MARIILILFFTVSSASLLSQNPEKDKSTSSDSKVIDTIIHSTALENNFLGDSPERNVIIYLPPGYDESDDKHYPVIYFLHSYAVDHTAFFGGYPWYNIDFKTICDDLIASGEIEPMIIVSPNSYNKYWGSFYTNSFVTGNWEDFIVDDVINYVDSNYRTLAQKESRGLAGHSMGGYGTIWLSMNNPNVFNAAYMLSGQVENEELNLVNGRASMIEAVNAESLDGLHWLTVVRIAQAAAVAPDTLAPPFYAQFPLDTSGALIDSIWQKWLKHDPLYLLPSYKDSLLKLKAIQFDVGTKDISGFINGNIKLSEALNDLGIEHSFEQYPGTHDNMLSRRIRTKVLPFFSSTLSKNLLSDTVPIPDTAFIAALIEQGVDTDGDSLISYGEAESVISLNVSGTLIEYNNISDMSGIQAFINLDTLSCIANKITSLNLSNNAELEVLDCGFNNLQSLDISGCVDLKHLSCSNSQTWGGSNQLSYLDLSNNTALITLGIDSNKLNSLDLSHNNKLEVLSCRHNQLVSLDLSKNLSLKDLSCGHNQVASLDLSKNLALTSLSVAGNELTSLDISNNLQLEWLDIGNLPNLYEVCVWTSEFPPAGVKIRKDENSYFTTECATGIEETGHLELTIYPNPTNTLLTIETEYPDHYSVDIFSLNGQQILNEEMEGTPHQLDLSSFDSGVYFITIRSSNFVTTRKVIKL